MKNRLANLFLLFVLCFCAATAAFAQKDGASKKDRKGAGETDSIGGREHAAEILGVKLGMDVPTALQTVFINANRQAGQEKPDSKRGEGKDKKDIRIIYKDLPQGELQIVFAGGKFVKEVALKYAKPPNIDDLRLPFTGFIGDGIVVSANRPDFAINATDVANTTRERGESYDGTRFDDRYSVGFTDNQKNQRIWWRDEKTVRNYRVRVQFFAADKIKDASAKFVVTAVRKLLLITPGDEAKFAQAFSLTDK
jgi:hypothetical protein